MRRWIVRGILAVLVLAGSVPLNSFGEEKDVVELSVLYSGADVTWVAAMEELSRKFMLENPDVVIYTENSDKGSCEDELKVKEALDEFPDIFELGNVDVFAKAGRLGALNEELSSLVTSPFTVGDTTYGLPMYAVTNGIIYNKEIFKKYDLNVPASYSEFLQVCEVLKQNGVVPLALGGNQEENLTYWLNYFFQKDVIADIPNWLELRKKGEVSFTDAKPQRMLEEYQQLVTSGYILEDSVDMSENQIVMKMVENEFAMIYAGPWMFSKIIEAYPLAIESDKTRLEEEIAQEDDPVTYRIGCFFVGDDNGETTALTQNSAYWAVSKECMADEKKGAVAEKFLRFFYKKENYRMMIQDIYGLPVTSEGIIYPAPLVQQRLLIDYRYAKKSQEYLKSFGVQEDFRSMLNEILHALYDGVYTPSEAALQMDLIWNQGMNGEK